MYNNNPIGVFDSGVGGLSVLRELKHLLPYESFIYFADSGNAPYGSKSPEQIFNLSKRIVNFFLKKKVKIIVLACNTGTAHAIKKLRKIYTIPFIGMEPAVKPAALKTKTGHIGVLATIGTFRGKHFEKTMKTYVKNVQVHMQVGMHLVEFVELGNFDSPEVRHTLKKFINPMLLAGIDKLVLGCTHYPFLYEAIKAVINDDSVEIIDPSEPVARQTKSILYSFNLECSCNIPPKYTFYTTGKHTETLKNMVKMIGFTENTEIIKINVMLDEV